MAPGLHHPLVFDTTLCRPTLIKIFEVLIRLDP